MYIQEFSNKEGAHQSAHPRSLISIFVIRLLERIISRLATSKLHYLASLCSRGDWFKSRCVFNPKDRLICRVGAHLIQWATIGPPAR